MNKLLEMDKLNEYWAFAAASLPLKLPLAWHAPEDKQVWFMIGRIR